MSFQTTDSKKEEFRKYLEKSGVIDQLTRVLVGLYEEPEKPNNSIEYIRKYMGAPTDVDESKLKIEIERVQDDNLKLKKEIESIKKEIKTLKGEWKSKHNLLFILSTPFLVTYFYQLHLHLII